MKRVEVLTAVPSLDVSGRRHRRPAPEKSVCSQCVLRVGDSVVWGDRQRDPMKQGLECGFFRSLAPSLCLAKICRQASALSQN